MKKVLSIKGFTGKECGNITNRSKVLEAYLFYENQAVDMDRLEKLVGIGPDQIKQLIDQLNLTYHNNGHAYQIVVEDDKIRLSITDNIKTKLDQLKEENFNQLTTVVDEYLYVMESEGNQKSSIYNYELLLKRFIKKVGKSVKDITLRDMRLFLMREQTEKENSNSTINHKKSMIKSFFNWLELEGRIEKNPSRRLKKSKTKDKQPNPFTHEQIETLKDAAESLIDRLLIELFYSSGLRISEVESLNWQDIDFAEKTIRVRDGKGGKDRITFLSTKAVMLLKQYKNQREDKKEYIFKSNYNKRMSRSSIYRHIKNIGDAAGFNNNENDNVKPHRFRHSFASHLLESGMEMHKVQKLLGHSDPATTQIYAKTNQADVKHSYRKVFH